MIRIAIVGSHSTGKSTLCRALAEVFRARGLRCHAPPEPISILAAKGTYRDPVQLALSLVAEHFRRFAAPDSDIVLLDRSLLDCQAYLRADDMGGPAVYDLIDALMPSYCARLDLIMYLPIEFAVVPDGRRPLSESYRAGIDAEIKNIAAAQGIAMIEVRGTPAQRLGRAWAAIEERLVVPR